jgi:hypothetical protein
MGMTAGHCIATIGVGATERGTRALDLWIDLGGAEIDERADRRQKPDTDRGKDVARGWSGEAAASENFARIGELGEKRPETSEGLLARFDELALDGFDARASGLDIVAVTHPKV